MHFASGGYIPEEILVPEGSIIAGSWAAYRLSDL
jgi:hypothetical protein